MFRAFVIGTALCTISISAFAQDNNNLVGKWIGSYLYTGSARSTAANVGIEVEITSVEGNVVKGVAQQFARICGGEYPLTGKIDGNNLGMISPPNLGGTGDCQFGFRVVVDGNKMTGKVGRYDAQMSKK